VNLHVYHYAGNNPVVMSDPDGRIDEVIWMQIEGGGQRNEISHQETDRAFSNWLETCDPKYYHIARDIKMYIENQATLGNRPTDEQIAKEADNAVLGQMIYAMVGTFALGLTQMPVLGASTSRSVPSKFSNTLRTIDETGTAPEGFRGGKTFANDGRSGSQVLPRTDRSGNPITYREWDVNPLQRGVNRGGERLITGSDGSAHYTTNHYQNINQIR